MAVFDVRGTNGAGKSHVVHSLLKNNGYNSLIENKRVIGYWLPKLELGIVGSYETQCGGCDGIKTADLITGRVREFHKLYKNIIFEGITISHTFGRYNKLALELGDYRFMFLTTPLTTCIARVRARRLAKGNTKPFDPDKHLGLSSDFERVRSAYRKLKEAGRTVIDLDWHDPMKQVMEQFR